MEYEYKVIDVADGAISSALLGEGRIETGVLEAYINAMASEGWRMVFMTKVMQRHLVVSDRETLMITFERRVPESEREARAARCIDDVMYYQIPPPSSLMAICSAHGIRREKERACRMFGCTICGTALPATW